MSRLLTLALGFTVLALWVATPLDAAEPSHGAAAGVHGGSTTHQAEPNILELKPPLAVATLIVFLVLLGVLWRFAWGPLSKALADREHHQEQILQKAEDARSESERLLAEHRALMAQAADQARQILEEYRRNGESTANGIVQKAQSEAEAARQRAEHDIHQARDQALMEIWSKTAELAVAVAGKVLSKQLGPDDHRRLVESAISELPASPNGHGGRTS